MKKIYLIACLLFVCMGLKITNPSWSAGSDLKAFAFPEVTGWRQSGEIQTYSPKDLYEYINGAADLYLAYDFQELKAAEYQNDRKANVTVDIYRHRTPNDAFGIYSQERLSSANFLDIGAQGYIDKEILNFVAGTHYVKINAFKVEPDEQEVLTSFARKVAENLKEKGALPSILARFPSEGKVKNSEKFIAKNFLGYAFLHSAFTADYEISGKKFKLFVVETGDKNECATMVQRYLKQTGKTEKEVTEGRHIIPDPHHGEIELHWKGAQIWGILEVNIPEVRSKYLKLFGEALAEKKE